MKETLPLGRIGGTRIGLHWSVLVVVALVTGSLATGRLPDAEPGRPTWQYWGVALLTAALFLASLLVHELAHAVVARRDKVGVDGITLWMLGGVARLSGEPPTPGAQARIAAAGPATSAAVGALGTVLALCVDAVHASALLVAAVAWTAAINFVLAVFNALPAAPLDGGRVLHAALWHHSGDRLRATRGAAGAGRLLGWVLMTTGFVVVLFVGDFAGIWSALVGWFLISAANAEERRATLHSALDGVPVRQVMTRDLVTVPATATLTAFLSEAPFGRYRHSAFPVVAADGTAAGLLTVRLVDRVPVTARGSTTAGEIAHRVPEVPATTPDEPVVDLLPRIEAARDHRALVLDEERRPVGIVTLTDVSRTLAWLSQATRLPSP
ncbi:site-2 protease family protein [Streptomyces sp. VRA16 Mangrove soil]|uniref:site-2 protease family protein n=1 Tax=Streptomyces sp. VRA16 Mangrove soil TaxID=2817434 RepID=UPI001A9ED860|nr:site-2 protease family protein [Streptomyces sp. VRA16 Mangrove soil]MBO1333018.1 site-2 protease family protein [Streptomyces sp. VRA16 Mangrove soil]